MGSCYARATLGVDNPRVAIVSNGEEEGKGNNLVLETLPLLKQAPFDFVGNAEGKDIPAGIADVIVTDGFTGNVILKTSEGVAKLMSGAIKTGIQQSPLTKIGALLAKPGLKYAANMLDYREYGAGALLGVRGTVLIGHGRSDTYAVRSAARLTKWAVEGGVVNAIGQGFLAENRQKKDIK
jgi:glycerol-3-phosphate acyltransferase PlsX